MRVVYAAIILKLIMLVALQTYVNFLLIQSLLQILANLQGLKPRYFNLAPQLPEHGHFKLCMAGGRDW